MQQVACFQSPVLDCYGKLPHFLHIGQPRLWFAAVRWRIEQVLCLPPRHHRHNPTIPLVQSLQMRQKTKDIRRLYKFKFHWVVLLSCMLWHFGVLPPKNRWGKFDQKFCTFFNGRYVSTKLRTKRRGRTPRFPFLFCWSILNSDQHKLNKDQNLCA